MALSHRDLHELGQPGAHAVRRVVAAQPLLVLGRLATVEEVAAAVVYLAAPASASSSMRSSRMRWRSSPGWSS